MNHGQSIGLRAVAAGIGVASITHLAPGGSSTEFRATLMSLLRQDSVSVVLALHEPESR
jgi:hypothetical protein